ncbi:MAG: HDOD domain-containing protein [Planctomycetota bacterium]|nr:HDOD domain-containing protein [Planctomycetota bacterium]
MQPASSQARRVELILHELESLPTLSAVAVRILALTTDEDAEAKEVIQLVGSDPALASKVLALCRCHDRGRGSRVTTVERAVLLLGFDAVRCAVLSVQVFEVLDRITSQGGEQPGKNPVFDREAFWLHALATATVSEQIARRASSTRGIPPAEAFTAGLLHDLGQLVLHVLLPESFDCVCRMADTHSASLDRTCHQVIGLDTHTAGKRLSEHWGLPRPLVDVIWLNGQPSGGLPDVPHRPLIEVVTLADALARHRYVTPRGHFSLNEDLSALCAPIGLEPTELEAIGAHLHDGVAEHAAALGISETCDPGVLLQSISRANESLARANAGMRQRERLARRQMRILDAIRHFHDAVGEFDTIGNVLAQIARSASSVFETAAVAVLYESSDDGSRRLVPFTADGRARGSRLIEPPAEAVPFATLLRDMPPTMSPARLLPWLSEHLGDEVELDEVRMLPLPCGAGGGSAILLLKAPPEGMEDGEDLEGLRQCWRAALAAGAQRDGAAHLTEQLAQANRTLLDTQEALARSRTLATLGEVAAGAAHEMNNPLTVISGRAQLLAARLPEGEFREDAAEIATQSHRLSDMITALRSFAEPIKPNLQPADLADLIVRTVQQLKCRGSRPPQISTVFPDPLPPVRVDADLLGRALLELLRNAAEAKGSRHIKVRVQTDGPDGRLKIEVRDDGSGLTEHVLRHAFDPFFSAKPAGRQPGLGLACARRYAEAHGGRITLVNGPSGGAVATIILEQWRDRPERRSAA